MLKKGEGKGRNDPLDYAKSQKYKYDELVISCHSRENGNPEEL